VSNELKVGDRVLTFQGEEGVIVYPWQRDDGAYHWWVDVEFEWRGSKRTTRVLFRNNELEKISER
jgi:hypothetical protein